METPRVSQPQLIKWCANDVTQRYGGPSGSPRGLESLGRIAPLYGANPSRPGPLHTRPFRHLAISRASGLLDLARYQGAVQADADRRSVGPPPALADHGDPHDRVRPLRWDAVGRPPPPPIRLPGAPAMDVCGAVSDVGGI